MPASRSPKVRRRTCCATRKWCAPISVTTMLEVEGLSHRYGRHEALHDVSIRLGANDTIAILAANGAGKTSLLNSIAGLVRPTSVSIRYRDTELVGLSPNRIVE